MKRRILSMIMVIVLAVSVFQLTALNADAAETDTIWV